MAQIQLSLLLEAYADAVPDRPALITNEVELTYAQLDERATRLAHHLRTSMGVTVGEHVAIHAMNCAEWVEAFYACFKLRAVPININFRYTGPELAYVYDNADAVVAIVGQAYAPVVDGLRADLPRLRAVLVMGDDYEAALAAASSERDFHGRSGDDHYVLYTGGTTGMPKGVLWRNEDIILGAMNSARGNAPIESPRALAASAAAQPGWMRFMALGPIMHGGAQWLMGNAHVSGGTTVLYSLPRFDAAEVWRLAARSGANSVSTIGDAMARPLAEVLLGPDRPDVDLGALFSIGNGGAPLTKSVREQLRAALPHVVIMDSFGASETGATGSKVDAGEGAPSPVFNMSATTTVLDDDNRPCPAGVIGRLATSGHIPLGYHKDPIKTAATFPVAGGTRWVVPGDFARIEADGSITLLGRGSACINSGGEKVFPEEVEAALKAHPAVFDAVVVATPHERWGEQVTAVVQCRDSAAQPSENELRAHCRTVIADYKVPKAVLWTDHVPRTPVGKADYPAATALARHLLGLA